MTVLEALELAGALRPNSGFDEQTMQLWLRHVDAGMRNSVVEKSKTDGAYDKVGADKGWSEGGLAPDRELLAPDAYSALYPHWLAAQIDLALGETARAANELQLYSEYMTEFAAWMRRRWPPAAQPKFRY